MKANNNKNILKIGILGGTFNPIHIGHLRAAEEVLEKLKLNFVIFMPSGSPPLKNNGLADAKHRYKMTRLATFRNRNFKISDIEYKKKSISYSVNTLKHLYRLYPDASFYFILGIDAFLEIPKWWKPKELLKLTNFVVISRPPFKFSDLSSFPFSKISESVLKKIETGKTGIYRTKLKTNRDVILLKLTPLEISSTVIRKLIKEGKTAKYLLPEEVESYIISNKIYR
ncbi:MAG: nicotinate-nucleotide adenylyltransferase [Nitrospiraceae bacterium]|nr:nicotinate-nucleotide adenylyltransferase [Nitrospiraceae bacterium]